jgi:hypothetical protein
MADVWNSQAWKAVQDKEELDKTLAEMEKNTGLTPADIEQFVIGGTLGKTERTAVFMVRTRKALDLKDMLGKMPAWKGQITEVKIGNYTTYQKPTPTSSDTGAVCAVDSRLFVLGSAAMLKAVLERDQKPEIPPGMQAALNAADFSKSVVVAVNVKDIPNKQAAFQEIPEVAPFVDTVDAAVVEVDVTSAVQIQAAIVFNDGSKAYEARNKIDGLLARFKPQLAALAGTEARDALAVSSLGNKVTVSTRFHVDPLQKSTGSVPAVLTSLFGRQTGAGPLDLGDRAPKDEWLADLPTALPKQIVDAWKGAGAKVGCIEVNGWAHVDFSEGPLVKSKGERFNLVFQVPAFRLVSWQSDQLAKLPVPSTPFGLSLYNPEKPGRGLKALAGMQGLEGLEVISVDMTDAGLGELPPLPNLRALRLHADKVTDVGVKKLAGLKSLQSLQVFVDMTDGGLKELAGHPNLRYLTTGGKKITDAGLKELARLKSLRTLLLIDTSVTHAGAKEFKSALPGCQLLGVKDEG